MNQAVIKCARFFKTLLHLSEKQVTQQQQSPGTIKAVRHLVRGVVFGALSPEEFTVRLQEALKSQAQQNLLPFLKQTLPELRTALQNGEQIIEGIGTAEEYFAEVNAIQKTEKEEELNRETNLATIGTNVATLGDLRGTTRPISANQFQQPLNANSPDGLTVMSQNEEGKIWSNHFPNTYFNPQAIVNRIYARMPECEGIDDEVLCMISNAAENKLRALSAKLSLVAEHRLEPLRLNPHYVQVDDPRKQLRCVEEVERRVYERRETMEREALLKISKSKGKDKDTMERIKLIQKADKEAELNREANVAAIAALGGLRGTKRPNSANQFQQPLNAGLTVTTHKPRLKRITARDLQMVLSTDAYGANTKLYYKLSYSNPGTLPSAVNSTKFKT